MKSFSTSLYLEMERQLKIVHDGSTDPILYAEKAIRLLADILEQLRDYVLDNPFPNKISEIDFFKQVKPQFMYRLIYYNEVYNIEISKPRGSQKMLRKFYNMELEKLKSFFDENIDFYKYYRTGSTHLDKTYFLRGKHNIRLTLDSSHFQADQKFSTSHDFKVATIIANDLLQVYLEAEISSIENSTIQKIKKKNGLSSQRWTGSKVALVELMYALHAEGVFNNGTSDLKEIAEFLENTMDVDLGQFHRVFLEVRSRKSDRTKFLHSLRDTLVRRMDEVDD